MTQLFAQPYDVTANGFYFHSLEEYQKRSSALRNSHGQIVEEFEIQFIDGEDIDCQFAKAIGLNQSNFPDFFRLVDEWEDHEKIRYIIAVGECGYAFDLKDDNIDMLDVDLYEEETMRDLAVRFVDDGLFGEVPEAFQYYINYDAIARDLQVDYSEIRINGLNLIYRCG